MHTRVGGPDPSSGRPAIVLVHGAVISGRYMLPLGRLLAASHPVRIPDLPGFGHSDDPMHPHDLDGLVDALVAWMDAMAITSAVLLGNSLGAQIITALAQRVPARAAGLVLVGPTVDRDARSSWQQLVRLAVDAFRERPSLIPLHAVDILRAGWRFGISTIRIALRDRIEDRLPRVRVPVLVLCGSRDPVAPAAWCRFLVACTPNGRLEVIDGPHALNYSRPREVAQAVERFIASLRDAR